MQAKVYSSESWLRTAVEFQPWFMTNKRKPHQMLSDTCEVRGALLRSLMLVLFSVFVHFNAILVVIGTTLDVGLWAFGTHALPVFDKATTPVVLNIIHAILGTVGLGTDNLIALPFILFVLPSIMLSVAIPVLFILAAAVFIAIFGMFLNEHIEGKRAYKKYVKRCMKYGVVPMEENEYWRYDKNPDRGEYEFICMQKGIQPIDRSDSDWKYQYWEFQREQKTKTGEFIDTVFDLTLGWARKFCKPVKWK